MSSSQNGEGRHDASGPPLTRPEWMLAPPPSASIGEMLRSDPRAALKSRGFAQSASQRVQKSGGGGGGGDQDNVTLWTETPEQRAERLRDEELGVRRRATQVEAGPSGSVQRDLAEREREDRIRAAVEQHKQTRGPSLLEQHQAKRRSELRKREEGSDDEEEERRRRRRLKESRRRDEEREEDSRRERRNRHRHRSISPSESDRADEHRAARRERRHRERREDHRRRDDPKAHSSRRSRSRSPSSRDDDKREERERRREKERKKRKREEEEREEKKGAPMMVWDRDAALSVGGRLMDERKRMDMIKNASSLNDRFGSGSSRYM